MAKGPIINLLVFLSTWGSALSPGVRICKTESCQEIGGLLRENLDRPECDDFYQFACGNWIKEHPLENGVLASGVMINLTLTNLRKVTAAVEGISSSDPRYLQMGKEFYEKCLSIVVTKTSRRVDAALQGIVDYIKKEYGGWPLVGMPFDPSKFKLEEMAGKIAHFTTSFFAVEIDVDLKNVSRFTMYISPPEEAFEFQSRFGKKCDLKSELKQEILAKAAFFRRLLLLLEYTDRVDEMADDVADISVLLCQAGRKIDASQSDLPFDYRAEKLSDLPDYFGYQWNWTAFFYAYIGEPSFAEYVETDPRIVFLHGGGDYLSALKSSFSRVRSKGPVALQNFMLYKFANQELQNLKDLGLLPEDVADVPRVMTLTRKVRANAPQQQFCVLVLDEYLPEVTTRLFLPNNASEIEEKKAHIQDFAETLLKAFAFSLATLSWDNRTMLRAMEKVAKIQVNTIAPDEALNDTLNNEIFSMLSLSPKDDFWQSRYKIIDWRRGDLGKLLLSMPNRSEFIQAPGLSAMYANAYYNPMANSITILDGLLQPPLYEASYPDVVKHGTIGFVIAHEIAHGFDPDGIQFSANGTYDPWMSERAKLFYDDNIADCVREEYDNFCYTIRTCPKTTFCTETTHCVNGMSTIGENLADNAAIKIAYLAFQQRETKTGPTPLLPGLTNFNPAQVFFISFASAWCENLDAAWLLKALETDPHSPGRDRVNGVLRNFPAFADAFSCSYGDRMRPVDSCSFY